MKKLTSILGTLALLSQNASAANEDIKDKVVVIRQMINELKEKNSAELKQLELLTLQLEGIEKEINSRNRTTQPSENQIKNN